jgi:hypothetical protein
LLIQCITDVDKINGPGEEGRNRRHLRVVSLWIVRKSDTNKKVIVQCFSLIGFIVSIKIVAIPDTEKCPMEGAAFN